MSQSPSGGEHVAPLDTMNLMSSLWFKTSFARTALSRSRLSERGEHLQSIGFDDRGLYFLALVSALMEQGVGIASTRTGAP
jgi:hypothetical protein